MNGLIHSLPAKVGALMLTFLCILVGAAACVGMIYAIDMDLYSGANVYPLETALLNVHSELEGELYYSSGLCRTRASGAAWELMRAAKNGEDPTQDYAPRYTNLRAVLYDSQGKLLFSSDEAVLLSADHRLNWIDRAEFDKCLQDDVTGELGSYVDPSTGEIVVWEPETDAVAALRADSRELAESTLPEGTVYIAVYDGEIEGYRVYLMLSVPMTVRDRFWTEKQAFDRMYPLRWGIPAVIVLAGLTGLCCVIFLCCAAGHRRDSYAVKLNYFDRIPLDLLLLIAVFLTAGLGFFALDWSSVTLNQLVILALCCAAGMMIWLPMLLTFCTRVKVGKWWKGTVIYCVLHLISKMLRALWRMVLAVPMVWRTLLVGGVILLNNMYLVSLSGMRNGTPVVAMFLIGLVLVVLACILSYQMQTLKRAGQALAQGSFDQKVSTRGMLPDLKQHGEDLNSLGDGLSAAVEERMRSERMKTELITNVSHDIKTPLTSIINYVDLLQKNPTDEEREQYLAVLDRQAKRLKKLTEDLVEASKASTGNLAVNLTPVDLHEFLNQAIGEYEDRLANARLTLVANISGEGLAAMADARHLWRIVDNLLNNACKYAMPETRVYLDAAAEGVYAVITVKNVSREALNVAPDELTERFVQGDSSRKTEGSGLGLNIAKSLAELQNGSIDIGIDGDLFKVTLTLPRCELPAKEEPV